MTKPAHLQFKNPSPQFNNNPPAGPRLQTNGARPLPPDVHLGRVSALENTTGSAIGRETGIETGIEIGSETGIGSVEQIEGTSLPAHAHTKNLDSRLRTLPQSKLIVNPRLDRLGVEVVGTETM